MTVYFIEALEINRVKIGFTGAEDPAARLRNMQTGSPCTLRVIGFGPGGRDVEARLFKMCARDRVGGEWFNLTQDVWAVIKSFLSEEGLPAEETPSEWELPRIELTGELEWAHRPERPQGDDHVWRLRDEARFVEEPAPETYKRPVLYLDLHNKTALDKQPIRDIG